MGLSYVYSLLSTMVMGGPPARDRCLKVCPGNMCLALRDEQVQSSAQAVWDAQVSVVLGCSLASAFLPC